MSRAACADIERRGRQSQCRLRVAHDWSRYRCTTSSAERRRRQRLNDAALARTIETAEAWYYSRSRRELWRKGATSGHTQRVVELRIDCDQDAVWIKVEQAGAGACHTGQRSCFYRAVPRGAAPAGSVALESRDAARVFDPGKVCGGGKD